MRHALDERLADAVRGLRALEARTPGRGGAVHVEHRGGNRWIFLDHPRAHNALTATMMRRLAEEIRGLRDFEGPAVVLASRHGGSFCAGGHLGQVREALLEPDAARAMSTHLGMVLDALGALPVVSISLLEGAAIGGGVELASATDFIVGTEACFFDPAQARLGVACGWGGAARLARRLGRAGAIRFLAQARRVHLPEALEIGLVDVQVEDPARAVDAVLGEAHAERARSIRAIKAQVDGLAPVEAFLDVWGGPAHRRALGV